MSDDIVTRLRRGDPHCTDGHVYDGWANEAADEIELLRANLKQALDNNDFWRDAAHRATCLICRGGENVR